jgi:hypothetical protein
MEPYEIDISGIPKEEVLLALYNGSRQIGSGFFLERGNSPMTLAEAVDEIRRAKQTYGGAIYFDYLHGRYLKADISGDIFDSRDYDSGLGKGSAARALAHLTGPRRAAEEPQPTVSLVLPQKEAYYLALFLKRASYSDYEALSDPNKPEEPQAIADSVAVAMTAFEKIGISPR